MFIYALNRQKLRRVWRREGRYLLRTNLTENDPTVLWQSARINAKFGVRRTFVPMAQPDDFRVRLGDAEVARIKAEIETRNAELVANANRDLWQRVQEVISRLVERLRNG